MKNLFALSAARMLATTVLLEFLQSQIIQFLLQSKLLKLLLQIDYRLFDSLLTLVPLSLTLGILQSILFCFQSLLLCLDPIDFLFKIEKSVSEILNHQILAFKLLFHEFKLFDTGY